MSSAVQAEFFVGGDGQISPPELLKGSWKIHILQDLGDLGDLWLSVASWYIVLYMQIPPAGVACQGLAKYKSCIISHKKWDFPSSQFFLHPLFLIKGDEGLWEQDTALHPSGMCPAQRKMPKH